MTNYTDKDRPVHKRREFIKLGTAGVVGSLAAAYMSTISTHLNWGSSYVVNDWYRRFLRPAADERAAPIIGRPVIQRHCATRPGAAHLHLFRHTLSIVAFLQRSGSIRRAGSNCLCHRDMLL